MKPERMNAFTDGVVAIIITIMVLELRVPTAGGFEALKPVLPLLAVYALSFVNVGIFWSNHHHMLHVTPRIEGGVLWANLHLLFWLSLVPFVTAWMGENHFASAPMSAYGFVLLMSGVAYLILQRRLIAIEGGDSMLSRAIGRDLKGKASAILYLIAIPMSFVNRGIAGAVYVGVALMWLVPDRRIERALAEREAERT